MARWGGPIGSQITLRSFLRSPVTGGAENDPRVTWDPMGPPKLPKVQGGIFIDGDRTILDESLWSQGRRSRAMTRNALEINRNERVGSLRFSLWKPSPLCILVLKASACGFRTTKHYNPKESKHDWFVWFPCSWVIN